MAWDADRYAADIDLTNENDSHVAMIKLVGGGKRVLDVGCWTGEMGAVLSRFNPRVVGIELDPDAAERAAKVLDRVVVSDISGLDFAEALGERFDAIVFGDVLEHVGDPLDVLRNARDVLDPDGIIVASIPNVAHGSVRLRLLLGEFDYTDTGLLDRTHIRFFTRESMLQLFRDAGLAIVDLQRTTIDPLLAPDRPFEEADAPADLLAAMRADEEALTYQFVVRAVRDGRSSSIAQLFERVSDLERRLSGRRASAATPRWRVAVRATRGGSGQETYLERLVEAELERRFGEPADVRLFTGDDALVADGWGPQAILTLEAADERLPQPVDALDLIGAFAARGPSTHPDRVSGLWEAAGRLPKARPRALVATDGLGDAELEAIAGALSTTNGTIGSVVLVHSSGDPSPNSGRFEALWPGEVRVVVRPADVDDFAGLVASADVVLSDHGLDRVVASTQGVPAAPVLANGDVLDVLDALDRSASEVGLGTTLAAAADAMLDRALAGAAPVVTDVLGEEVGRLRTTVTALQQRIVDERDRLIPHLTELTLAAQGAGTARDRAEALAREVAALDAALAAQRDAIVDLQARFVATPAAVSIVATASLTRRIARRVRRSLRV